MRSGPRPTKHGRYASSATRARKMGHIPLVQRLAEESGTLQRNHFSLVTKFRYIYITILQYIWGYVTIDTYIFEAKIWGILKQKYRAYLNHVKLLKPF